MECTRFHLECTLWIVQLETVPIMVNFELNNIRCINWESIVCPILTYDFDRLRRDKPPDLQTAQLGSTFELNAS